jgi:hypothetical protein
MKAWRKLLAMAALAVSGMTAGGAFAQNLLLNPSFEAGLANWTDTGGACTYEALSPPSNSAGAGAFATPTPPNGAALLMTDATNPGVCQIFQDVVATSPYLTLTAAVGYNYENFGSAAAPGCGASVEATTTTGTVLASLYSPVGGTASVEPPANRGPVNFAVRNGDTVRIIVTATSCADGPAGIAADNFSLVAAAQPVGIPTLAEWALILLALLMAGAAATMLRTKRAARA